MRMSASAVRCWTCCDLASWSRRAHAPISPGSRSSRSGPVCTWATRGRSRRWPDPTRSTTMLGGSACCRSTPCARRACHCRCSCGDDIEYGCRLKRAGVRTLVPPGVAIWHEPFDAKTGGWQSYFATRNFLIAAACRGEGWAKTAGKAVRRRVVISLLACDYYEAWLICEGVADFLAGPTILEGDPSSLLGRLQSGRPPRTARRPSPRLPPLPLRHRYLFSRRLRRLERRWQMLRHWLMPAPAQVHVEGFVAA